jgi:undecaprenyl pyrophosphate phosphatase UppP
MKHRRRLLVLGSTIAAIVVAVIGVLVYDAAAGGVNRPLVIGIVVVMALVIGPLLGLWIAGPIEDGELDDAAHDRAPSRT